MRVEIIGGFLSDFADAYLILCQGRLDVVVEEIRVSMNLELT